MTAEIKLPPLPASEEVTRQLENAFPWVEVHILMVDYARAAIEADRQQRGEPVAYAVFAENGNIRIWCADPIQAEALRQEYGNRLQSLYTAPKFGEE